LGFPLKRKHLGDGLGQPHRDSRAVMGRRITIATTPVLKLHRIDREALKNPGISLVHNKVLTVLVAVTPARKILALPSNGLLVDRGVVELEPKGYRSHRGSDIKREIRHPIQVGITHLEIGLQAETAICSG
jgi:hypothetical protein